MPVAKSKKTIIGALHLLVLTSNTWEKTFGGAKYDYGYSVQQTNDGGYIVAGQTHSFAAWTSDGYLIKTDPKGRVQWTKTFGAVSSGSANSVRQTDDGGYIVGGVRDASPILIKLDKNGENQWAAYIGNDWEYLYSVRQTRDGGYIVAGRMDDGSGEFETAAGAVLKTDASGVVQWNKSFGGYDSYDFAHSAQQTEDGGYIATGRLGNRLFIIKYGANGGKQWNRSFDDTQLGGEWNDWFEGDSVQQTDDGGYIVTGTHYYNSTYSGDAILVKTYNNGLIKWNKTFGGPGSDHGSSVQQTVDGGYIVAGGTNSFGAGDSDIYLVKADTNGDILWRRTFGGAKWDYGASVEQTKDGGFIIAGSTASSGAGKSDVYLIKID